MPAARHCKVCEVGGLIKVGGWDYQFSSKNDYKALHLWIQQTTVSLTRTGRFHGPFPPFVFGIGLYVILQHKHLSATSQDVRQKEGCSQDNGELYHNTTAHDGSFGSWGSGDMITGDPGGE